MLLPSQIFMDGKNESQTKKQTMKNSKHIMNNFQIVVFETATLIGAASLSNLRRQNEPVLVTTVVKTDAQFLTSAAEINLEEIQLGQLAKKKITMIDVQELGKMMKTGHRKSLSDPMRRFLFP